MKKIIIAIMMTLLITGCGGKEITNLDINKTASIIEKSLSNMEEVESSELSDVYGMNMEMFKEYKLKQNSEGDMYAIIKFENKNSVKEEMKKYFDKVRDFNVAYSPERVKLIDERLEKEVGEYLIYIVASDSEKIYKEIIDSME